MMMPLSPETSMTSIHKPHSDGGTRNSGGGWENNNPQLRRSHSYKMKGERMSLHLDTRMWLKTLELEEYGTLFMSYPYVETLLHFTEKDLQGLGISNAAHRARLSSNIVFIREKLKYSSNGYHQLTNNRPKRFSCGSPSASPTNWNINQYRYSTIPELGTLQQVTPPIRKKMELKDSSPEELRRELEEELKLPNDDVRSHAWFHGGISREKAEKQIRENGDFLVRDSISRPGSFVLSVYWRSTPMHFVINRVVVQHDTPYATVQYQFEKECFSCIPSLVRFYVGNCKPVSQVSGAVIQRPVNRTMPLSYIDSKYAEFNKVQGNVNHIYCAVPKKVKTPKLLIGSPLRQRCESQPSVLISKPEMMERSGSQPLLDTKPNGFHQQLPLRSDDDHRPLERTGSEPVLSPTSVRRSFGSLEPDYMETKPHFGSDSKISVKENPPGKPVRALDLREHHYQEIPSADQSVQLTRLHDHDTTTPQTFMYPENDHQLNEEKPRQRIFSDTRDSTLDCNYSMMGRDITPYEKQLPCIILPIEETSSMFQPLELKTSFFGSDNKPLEASAMIAVKRMLLEEDPLLLAKHLTSVDLEVCRILNPGCNTLPGLELITLPPGRQLRRDLMERYNCIKTWLSIILLTTVEKDTRVKLLSQWILIAECLRTNMGNMFGFAAIMDGLGSKQVCNLKQTWEGLRTTFTSIAVTYETKLRSLLKSLNAGENVIPLTKTCIPHVIPLVQLLERDWSVLESQDWSQPVSQDVLDSLPQGESWEESTASFGMDPLVNHLQNAHLFVQQIKLFHINADLKLQKFLPDDDMLDICRTDFHLRLLWGSKGALVNREERYRKFDRVLTVMSEKLESVVLPVSYSK